jgi:hypothetical protein
MKQNKNRENKKHKTTRHTTLNAKGYGGGADNP